MKFFNLFFSLNSVKPEDGRIFHLFFVPFVSEVCRKKLKDLEILDRFESVKDLPILLFPQETDLLSMERPELFRVKIPLWNFWNPVLKFFLIFQDFLLFQDETFLFEIANSILQLESIFGRISQIFYKGFWAEATVKFLKQKREENSAIVPPHNLIDSLIVFDRNLDLISPMVTQLTYEGLIDEIYGIKNSKKGVGGRGTREELLVWIFLTFFF